MQGQTRFTIKDGSKTLETLLSDTSQNTGVETKLNVLEQNFCSSWICYCDGTFADTNVWNRKLKSHDRDSYSRKERSKRGH